MLGLCLDQLPVAKGKLAFVAKGLPQADGMLGFVHSRFRWPEPIWRAQNIQVVVDYIP